MTSREAFEAWKESDAFDIYLSVPLDMPLLMEFVELTFTAAWEARGKHDAEVCRKVSLRMDDGEHDEDGGCWQCGTVRGADICREEIEEQD